MIRRLTPPLGWSAEELQCVAVIARYHGGALPQTSNSRSEEHTSELQSLRHLVCRFLPDTATTEIYTLSLHDALPISLGWSAEELQCVAVIARYHGGALPQTSNS